MGQILKQLSLLLTLLLVVILVAGVWVMTSDANQFKPQLTRIAEQSGIELQIDGDLEWQLYPDIRLAVQELSAASDEADQSFNAQAKRAEVEVDLMGLFSGSARTRAQAGRCESCC